jgi:predicted transcriptional regulator
VEPSAQACPKCGAGLGLSLGEYRLALIEGNAFLYDKDGNAVFSRKHRYLNAEKTVKQLAEITKVDRAEVERTVAALLFKAASIRRAGSRNPRQPPPSPQGAEDPAPSLDAEVEARIQAEVQRIVEAENQLEALKPHLDVVVVGEDENKQVVYVLLLGSKYGEPDKKTIIVLKGTEGGGKTHLASALTAPFRTKEVGRFTEHALEYSDLARYEVLYIKELGTMDVERQGVATVKFLSADDRGFVVEYTIKDESGRFRTEQRRIPAMTVVSTTTRLVLDRQFERRAWILNVDESEGQTERVKRWKAELWRQRDEVKLGLRKVTDYDFSREVLRRYTAQLKPQKIVIPFREALADVLGSKALRVRGDVDKVYAFIELYALLNLKRLWRLREDVYAVTPEVALEALRLIERPLRRMLTRVDDRVAPLLETLKELGLGSAGAQIDKVARERIAVRLNKSERTVRDLLNSLEVWGYVSGDQRRPKTYTLLYSVDDIEAERAGFSAVSGTADSLKERMVKEARSWLGNGLETSPSGGQSGEAREAERTSTAKVEGQPAPRRPPSPAAAPAPAGFQPASERPPARSLNESSSEDRLFRKLPILQPDSYTMCRECRHYVGPGCELNLGKIIVPTARACEKFEPREGVEGEP